MKELLFFLIVTVSDYLFLFIFFFGCFVFLVLSFYAKNKILKNTALICFSVFFVFCFFELMFAFQMDVFKYSEPDKELIENIDNFHVEHKIYIQDNKGQRKRYLFQKESEKEEFLSKKQYKIIYDVDYSMLGKFFRYTKGNISSENAYVFLGCSFTFGDGLKDDQTLPYYFSKLNNFNSNVLNFGVIGKSTNFGLNILNSNIINKYLTKAKNIHFIYSLISDQAFRNFNFDLYDRSDDWIYKDRKWMRIKQPFETVQIIFAKSYIFRKIFLPLIDDSNSDFYENYIINSLNEIRKIAKNKYNAEFTIIVWPSIEINFKTKLAIEKFDIIELPEYFEPHEAGSPYRILYDDHPTAKANEEIAEILDEHLKSLYVPETKND